MWMYDGERPKLSKLPADLEHLSNQYAQNMRRLYAVLSEMFGGGPGVERIDDVFADTVKARNAVYKKLQEMRHDRPDEPQDAFVRAEEAVRYQLLDALALPPDPVIDTGQTFEENEVKLTKQAAKLVAHRLKKMVGDGSKAREAFRATVIAVGSLETSDARKQQRHEAEVRRKGIKPLPPRSGKAGKAHK